MISSQYLKAFHREKYDHIYEEYFFIETYGLVMTGQIKDGKMFCKIGCFQIFQKFDRR